jgi:exodeoxyribonuclease-3
MRVATWNVNSLKTRLPKCAWWLERAQPDVLLMQETKLADADAPATSWRSWLRARPPR